MVLTERVERKDDNEKGRIMAGWGNFRKKKISDQMKWILLFTVILFAVLCTLINKATKEAVYQNADEHTKITAIRLKDQIGMNYDKLENFCMNMRSEESICNLMQSDYSEMGDYVKDARECLASYKILEPAIEDIALVNDKIHYSTVYTYEKLDEIRRSVNGVTFCWIGMESHTFVPAAGKRDMMVYAGDVFSDGENIGTLIFSLDSSSLQIEEEEEMSTSYFIADDQGSLYPFNCSSQTAEKVHAVWKENGAGDYIKKAPYYIHANYFTDMGCYLVSALDVRGADSGMSQIQILIWSCVIMAVFFCLVFFFIIDSSVVGPLHQFSHAMTRIRELRQRHLKEELHLGGCAEITEIGKEFSNMLWDIESMNQQIFKSATDLYEMKVQKQEAELAYMRSQIDPHFLYNTLEVVRKMALAKDAPEIARMAVDMGNIFRYSIKGNYEVPLEKEISMIKSYIRIQQMRFQGKIEVFYFISEEVLTLKVIKMLLQPIVENAIFHGLEPKSGEGSLFIGARRDDNKLVLTVKDDGIGIPPDILEGIQEGLREENVDTSQHVGILNTNARIWMQYGKEYGMTVESCQEDGTTVTMILPAMEMQ